MLKRYIMLSFPHVSMFIHLILILSLETNFTTNPLQTIQYIRPGPCTPIPSSTRNISIRQETTNNNSTSSQIQHAFLYPLRRPHGFVYSCLIYTISSNKLLLRCHQRIQTLFIRPNIHIARRPLNQHPHLRANIQHHALQMGHRLRCRVRQLRRLEHQDHWGLLAGYQLEVDGGAL